MNKVFTKEIKLHFNEGSTTIFTDVYLMETDVNLIIFRPIDKDMKIYSYNKSNIVNLEFVMDREIAEELFFNAL